MIIGEHSRENDLTVNVTKAKQMTNVRSANKDQTNVIKTPRILTLEESIEFMKMYQSVPSLSKMVRLLRGPIMRVSCIKKQLTMLKFVPLIGRMRLSVIGVYLIALYLSRLSLVSCVRGRFLLLDYHRFISALPTLNLVELYPFTKF